MRSNKGQALLEFVLILPVFLLILFAVIDFGRIIYEKNRLEGVITDVADLINNDKLSDAEIEKSVEKDYQIPISLVVSRKAEKIYVKVSRSIDVFTPGLGIAIQDPYTVEVSRVIPNE